MTGHLVEAGSEQPRIGEKPDRLCRRNVWWDLGTGTSINLALTGADEADHDPPQRLPLLRRELF